jgi:hypothetical protein
MFNGQRVELIFKPLTLSAVKFLPAVNGKGGQATLKLLRRRNKTQFLNQ